MLPADFDLRYDARERELILAHERVHFERGDAWINAFVVALRSLNWFNPLLHYAAATFRFDQELACDAAVIARFPEARRRYVDAMLKMQLAGQPRQELRLPVGCRWPSHRTLKERILMLKQSRPARATRAAGFAFVSIVTLAFAYAAWASQSPRTPTVPADGRQVDATLRIDIGGKAGKPVRVVHPLGSGFEVADGAWRATFVANATADGDIALDTTIRDGDRVVGSPSVVARRDEPFTVAVGDAGREAFRVEGALAFADATRAVPAKVAKPTVVDASYRAVKPPVYPAEAVKGGSRAWSTSGWRSARMGACATPGCRKARQRRWARPPWRRWNRGRSIRRSRAVRRSKAPLSCRSSSGSTRRALPRARLRSPARSTRSPSAAT